MEKKATSSVVMGLLITLVLIVISLVMYFTDLYMETWNQYLGFVILFAGVIIAVLMHAKEVNYHATFGNLFGFGFKVTAAITVLMILYVIISGFIFTDVKTRYMEMAREQMAKSQQNASADQIEQGMQFMEKNFTLFIILGILFWYLVCGAIASLIGAAVAKKRPPVAEFENV